MTIIAINRCHGGFSLSPAATLEFYRRKGKECFFFRYKGDSPVSVDEVGDEAFWVSRHGPHKDSEYATSRPEDRADPDLIAVITDMGDAANGSCAAIELVEIPDGVEWSIGEYDGLEHVAEAHRVWP